MTDLWIYILVIVFALVFDFTNGFHDTANSIAAAVATRAIKPKHAVVMAAALNFVGALISIEVATTVGKGVIDQELTTLPIVLAGMIGAITWNIITWYFGLPSSSSHALVGGLVGAALAGAGPEIVKVGGVVQKVAIPALIAPTLGFIGAFVLLGLLMRASRNMEATSGHANFRKLQWISSGWLSLSHGMNDAQKTMGIMFLATITYTGADGDLPMWIRLSAATAMAAGTYAGGWRLIKTLGTKVVKMQPIQGFTASTSSAGVLFMASHLGIPVSTTHTVTGGVLGAGAGRRASAVRWSVAGEIGAAWIMTLPAAAAVGAVAYGLVSIHPFVLLAAVGAGGLFLKMSMDSKRAARTLMQGFESSPPEGSTLDTDRPPQSSVPTPPADVPRPRGAKRPEQAPEPAATSVQTTTTQREQPTPTERVALHRRRSPLDDLDVPAASAETPATRPVTRLRLPTLSSPGTITGKRRPPTFTGTGQDEAP